MGARTQLWLPWKTRVPWADKVNAKALERGDLMPIPGGVSHYSRWWSPIVWHPKR
jgi:hypothetical protein